MGCFEESHGRQASVHIKEAFYKSLDQKSYTPLQKAFTCPSHKYFRKSRQDFQLHTAGNGLSQLEDWLTYKPVEWFLQSPAHVVWLPAVPFTCLPRPYPSFCCSSSSLNLKETQCLSTTLPCILMKSVHFPLKVEPEYQGIYKASNVSLNALWYLAYR